MFCLGCYHRDDFSDMNLIRFSNTTTLVVFIFALSYWLTRLRKALADIGACVV